MTFHATIDGAGRFVVPKPLRDRFHLSPGTRITIQDVDGALVIMADRPAPAVVETESGRLVIDLGVDIVQGVDHFDARDARLQELVAYATRR